MLVTIVQQQFQNIYQLPHDLSIEDFLINQEALETVQEKQCALLSTAHHRGFMLLFSEGNELHVGIYLHNQLLDNLRKHNPLFGLHEKNIGDFCIMIEEVSHFLYTTWRAQHDIRMTKLEIELQAEVDKFVLCSLYRAQHPESLDRLPLIELLFESYHFEKNLPEESQQRYHTASRLASHYCHFLNRHFINDNHIPQMIKEIRQFYRYSQTDKISHINRTSLSH
jgi:hypothetical protein